MLRTRDGRATLSSERAAVTVVVRAPTGPGSPVPHVGSFSSRPHAEMAAGMLAAHGIRALVAGDDAGGIAPHVTFISGGGYALSVDADDVAEAEALLAQARPDRVTPADDADGGVDGRLVVASRAPSSTTRAFVLRLVLRAALAVFVAVVVLQSLR